MSGLYKKCTEDNICKWLNERCQEIRPGGVKGFIKTSYMNIQTDEPAGMVVFYSTGRKDKGMALNFCPFCGFSFHDLYKQGRRVGGGTIQFEVDEEVRNVQQD